MDIATLVGRFEAGTLAGEDFHHREHLQIAWFYLGRFGQDEALGRLCDGLLAFAARMGKVEKFDDALTRAWVAALDAARRLHPEARSFEALVAARPDLLDPSTVTARR